MLHAHHMTERPQTSSTDMVSQADSTALLSDMLQCLTVTQMHTKDLPVTYQVTLPCFFFSMSLLGWDF